MLAYRLIDHIPGLNTREKNEHVSCIAPTGSAERFAAVSQGLPYINSHLNLEKKALIYRAGWCKDTFKTCVQEMISVNLYQDTDCSD